MVYFKTPEGVIFNEDNIIIEPNDNNPLWIEYVEYLTNDGIVTQVDYEITQPVPEIPSEVALWKLRFILSQMNLEESVVSALSLLPEPQKTAANYIWNYGNAIDRYSSTIMFLQQQLELTDAQVDQIFIQANSITL
jgi:hypothetical protein